MKRWIAMISVAGLFLLGILVGALGMHLYDVRHGPGLRPPFDSHRGPGGRFLHRLEGELGLSAEQSEQVRRIMREAEAESRELHHEMLPRVHEQMERTREKIEAVLTPEQRETFREFHQRHRRGAERFFLGH